MPPETVVMGRDGERALLARLGAALATAARNGGTVDAAALRDLDRARRLVERAEGRELEAAAVSGYRRERVEWLVEPSIALGAVTLLVGDPGLGKSMLTCRLAALLSRGELGEPGVTLLATAEDSIEYTVRPRLEAVGADLDRVRIVRLRAEGGEEGLTLPDDAGRLGQLVRETGARLVVIDPLSAHLGQAIDSHRDASVRRALAPLHRVASEHRCALLVVAHLNKGQSTSAIHRVGGSIGITGAARSVLLFARDPDDPDGETGQRRLLLHVKSNLGRYAETLAYEVESILLPGDGAAPEVETARLRETGTSGFTATDVLSLQAGETYGRLQEAEEYLQASLADGPRPRVEVEEAAHQQGIAKRTLERAKRQLGVLSRKDGDGGKWTWRLPQAEEPQP